MLLMVVSAADMMDLNITGYLYVDWIFCPVILDNLGGAAVSVALASCLLSRLYADYILLRYYGEPWIFLGDLLSQDFT